MNLQKQLKMHIDIKDHIEEKFKDHYKKDVSKKLNDHIEQGVTALEKQYLTKHSRNPSSQDSDRSSFHRMSFDKSDKVKTPTIEPGQFFNSPSRL